MRSTDQAKPNVVEFRSRAPKFLGYETQVRSDHPEIACVASSIVGLQLRAKGEIGNAILMLDLAAQHAHEIARLASDSAARKNLDQNIAIIERLLDLAREMTFKL